MDFALEPVLPPTQADDFVDEIFSRGLPFVPRTNVNTQMMTSGRLVFETSCPLCFCALMTTNAR